MPDVSNRFPEPTEAVRFLSRKRIVETEEWTDLGAHEHAHAFTVAHSAGAGVLEDIHALIIEAAESGQTLDDFRAEMRNLMAERGWYGRKGITPDTPEGERYINRRIKTIFQTNMNTATNAGAYRQQLRVSDDRPWWVYKSLLVGPNRRDSHKALHNSAYPAGHSFWDRYYPPNGWGCQCDVVSMDDDDLEDYGITKIEPAVPPEFVSSVPDEWRHNPGQAYFTPDFSQFNMLRRYEMPDGRRAIEVVQDAYIRDMQRIVLTGDEVAGLLRAITRRGYRIHNVPYPIGVVDQETLSALEAAGITVDPGITATDRRLLHGVRQAKSTRGQTVSEDEFSRISQAINEPAAVWENTKPTHAQRELHFVTETDSGRLVVAVFHVDGVSLGFRTVTKQPEGYRYEAHREYRRVK